MKKLLRILFFCSFIIYLACLIVILFVGTRGIGFAQELPLIEYIKTSSNFVPFKTIITYIEALRYGTMNIDIPIKNLLGNLILFLPMGIYLPILLQYLKGFTGFIISIILVLIFVEVLQLLTRLGSFDIDDFILNITGAVIGYGAYVLLNRLKIINLLKPYQIS